MTQSTLRLMFRRDWPLLCILLMGATLGLLCIRSLQIGQPADDADYLILAESLATGRGLRLINFPTAPMEQWFPAGWPLLLAPILLISPKNYELTRIVPYASTLAAIVVMYGIGRNYWRRDIQIASTLLFAVSPVIVIGAGSPLSEPAYLTFSLLAIICVERLLVDERATVRLLLATSIMVAATIAIRTIGLTLFAATVVYLLLRRKARSAFALLVITPILLIPQFILNSMAGGGVLSPSYQAVIDGGLAEKIDHVFQNLATYVIDIIPNMLVGLFGPQIDQFLQTRGLAFGGSLLKAALIGTVCVGLATSLRAFRLYHVYTVLFFGATLLYYNPVSGSASTRYAVPILPFLIAFFLVGASSAINGLVRIARNARQRDHFSRAAVAVLTATVAIISVGRVIQQGMISPLKDRMTDVSIGSSWINANTQPSAIIAMPNPIPRYIYAQRDVLWFPSVQSQEELMAWLEAQGVTHLMVGPPLRPSVDTALDEYQLAYVIPLVLSYPEHFRLDYTNDQWNVKVYSIR